MTTLPKARIEVIDSLRGFALLGIMLLHSIEHFNFYVFPNTDGYPAWLKAFDKGVWDSLFFMFGGKGYAIFSLLFGFTFSLMLAKQIKLGTDFGPRFLWRMLLLVGFAIINGALFPGEVLLMYALLGSSLFFVRKLNTKALLLVALFFLLQPIDWSRVIHYLIDNDYTLPARQSRQYWSLLKEGQFDKSLFNLMKSNTLYGHKVGLLWAWEVGRMSQTLGLFILGFWLGKTERLNDTIRYASFWKKTLIISALAFIPLYLLRANINTIIDEKVLLKSIRPVVEMYRNLAFTLFLTSGFIQLYRTSFFRKVASGLAYPGRMSLTAYVFQSLVGGFVFYGYGLGMGPKVSHTAALGIGIILYVLMFYFCKWWILKYKQGPLEKLWHKLTWINN